MANETIEILKLQVQGAESVADLRSNVKLLKEELKNAEEQANTPEGWEHYQKTLEILKQNQNALKDVVYATSGTFDDVKKAATGASESYNSLVNRMADLKREFRATNDEARRLELAGKINEVNTQLKALDALQGNFQRNVGNYQSAFKNWGDQVDALRKGLGSMKGGLNGVKDGFEALQKSPGIATFSILVSLAARLVAELKDNEKATAALKTVMDSLKPVMDFFSGILDDIIDYLVEIIEKVSAFLSSSGLFNKIVRGVIGVGNAITQFIIAPFKGIAAAVKVFQEEGIKGFRNAAKAFNDEANKGISFKQNYEAGQKIADGMISGAKSRKKKAGDAGKELGEEAAKKAAEAMYKKFADALKRRESMDAAWRDALATWQKALDDAMKESNEEMTDWIQADFDAQLEALKEELEAEEKLRQEDLEKQKKIADAKKALMQGVANATSDILGSIADLYETDEENAVKNANKIKALRIASATVDTISGAIGAYMQAAKNTPPPYGQILGAISAAAVTAAGIANIAKIKATKVSTEGGASATPTIAATVSAPTLQTQVSNVRSVTSASEEDRLNRMAKDQRVYILSSDIEASQRQIRTRVAEASF